MNNLPMNANFPAPTPQLSQSLSQEERGAHRTRISFEVEVVLSGYWQAEMDARLRAGVLSDWADELEDWPIDQVRFGLREWRRDNPRRKPNPGDILSVLKRLRGEAHAKRLAMLPKPAEPDRDLPSAERRAEMAAEAAALLKGMGL